MSAQSIGTDAPPVSEHAATRWDERTDPSSVAPETAWRHGQRIAVVGSAIRADEVRYHRPTDTLLLFRPPSITTILTVDEASEDQYHAIKHALPNDE